MPRIKKEETKQEPDQIDFFFKLIRNRGIYKTLHDREETDADIREVIGETIESEDFQKYKTDRTRLTIIERDLKEAYALEQTAKKTDNKSGDWYAGNCFVFAKSDKQSENAPITFISVDKDSGEIITFPAFKGALSGAKLPFEAHIEGFRDEKYDQVQCYLDNAENFVFIGACDWEDVAKAVRMKAHSIYDSDFMFDTKMWKHYAITGEIKEIQAERIYSSDPDAEKADYPLLYKNANDAGKLYPQFVITTERDDNRNGVYVKLKIPKQVRCMPQVRVDEMMDIISEGVEKYPMNPGSAASCASKYLHGREFIAIGQMVYQNLSPANGKKYSSFTFNVFYIIDDDYTVQYDFSAYTPAAVESKETETENEIIEGLVNLYNSLRVEPTSVSIDYMRANLGAPETVTDAVLIRLQKEASSRIASSS